MIGLVDYDFQTSPIIQPSPPNIEIMKLASYYMAEENTFCRIIDLQETDLTPYDKIYFFSESEKQIVIPEQFKRAQNVIFGGTYFTNTYQPFKNEVIDYMIPRREVYKRILKERFQAGANVKDIAHILDDSYYRNYAGENKLPLPPMMSRKRIILYDKDFFYPDWKDTLEKITSRRISTILRIHPIICNKLNNYFALRDFKKFSRTNTVILDLDIPSSDISYLLKKYTNMFLADITHNSNVCITLGGNFKYRKQYQDDFIYKMNLLYSFWAKNIPIKIKYMYPKIGYSNPIEHISLLIEKWANTQSKLNRTIEDRLPKTKQTDENIEYDLVINYNKDSLLLFRQTYEKLLRQGSWL